MAERQRRRILIGMTVSGLNHVTLAVAELDTSVAFYRDILGGHVRAIGARIAYLSMGDLWLCLAQGPVDVREDYTHIALSCPPQDFAAMSAKIRDAAPEWQDNASEGASVYFLDPDGHRLELHQGDLDTRLADYRSRDAGMRVLD